MPNVPVKPTPGKPLRAHVAHLCLPKPGERENGDAVLVREDEQGRTMLAVVDALGHGPEAAEVSRAALARLSSLPLDVPVLDAMQAVHATLRGTRGAAATVCLLAGTSFEVCAVGNVQLLCANCEVPLVLSPGVLGHQVSRFRVTAVELRAGARIALISDGVSLRFRLEELRHFGPAEVCDFVIKRYRRLEDDATVLVADLEKLMARHPIHDPLDVHVPRQAVTSLCAKLGFPRRDCHELAIVVSELCSNIVKYGVRGSVELDRTTHPAYGLGVLVVARDEGPPFRDLGMALQDGCDDRGPIDPATLLKRRGLGIGLGAVVRLTDSFEVEQLRDGKTIRAIRYVNRPRHWRSSGSSF